MRQGLAAYQATGAGLGQPGNLYELARAQYLAGQVGPGLELLTTALATVNDTGERWYEAELYRLKGILTLQSQTSLKPVSDKSQASQYTPKGNNPQSAIRNPQLAEACFLQAIDIARQQQARSLELRVVTSLSRLWQRQGRRREAHGLLSKIYAWFTEGFDTKDLQEAKMLLEELSR
jgi:predicted ATPase